MPSVLHEDVSASWARSADPCADREFLTQPHSLDTVCAACSSLRTPFLCSYSWQIFENWRARKLVETLTPAQQEAMRQKIVSYDIFHDKKPWPCDRCVSAMGLPWMTTWPFASVCMRDARIETPH